MQQVICPGQKQMPGSNQKKRARLAKPQERYSSLQRTALETVATPEHAVGLIILPVTIPLSVSSNGLRRVAAGLQDRGFATVLADLLAIEELDHGYHNFDFEMLADRIAEITDHLHRKHALKDLPIGYFGMGTDAAGMAIAAARSGCPASAWSCAMLARSLRRSSCRESLLPPSLSLKTMSWHWA
jgi:hypothetical protein